MKTLSEVLNSDTPALGVSELVEEKMQSALDAVLAGKFDAVLESHGFVSEKKRVKEEDDEGMYDEKDPDKEETDDKDDE
jgi:hypothetical protein